MSHDPISYLGISDVTPWGSQMGRKPGSGQGLMPSSEILLSLPKEGNDDIKLYFLLCVGSLLLCPLPASLWPPSGT